MHIKITNLQPTKSVDMYLPIHIKIAIFLVCAFAVINSVHSQSQQPPKQQEFVLTAYYSPLEGQCCYVKGGVIADRILNGEGHTTADGTSVYPGVVAAPGTYPFGTVIELPGYGVFKVHDRGGAIQEWNNGKHRLDLWVGHGEEGLARALQLGLKDVKGTIYYPGTPAPEVSFNFDSIVAPNYQLERFLIYDNLLAVTPKLNDTGLSVEMLQNVLQVLGYFNEQPTSFFGANTQTALGRFITDFRLNQPNDRLTSKTAAYLLAAVARKNAQLPLSEFITADASPKAIAEAQRLLRLVNYYKGRINGLYSQELKEAIFAFQKDNYLVGDWESSGAGQIGPLTSRSLQAAWNRDLVTSRANKNLLYFDIEKQLKQDGKIVESFLSEGNSGPQVTRLQNLLSDVGFFESQEVNGNFGAMTKDAVTAYQLHHKIINSKYADSAGTVGPKTLTHMQRMQGKKYYQLVRSYGLEIL